jgi:hypothetical protein
LILIIMISFLSLEEIKNGVTLSFFNFHIKKQLLFLP